MTGWTTNPADRVMLAFSVASTIELLLPATDDNTSSLHIIVHIRDTYDCLTEWNMSSVRVQPDSSQMANLVNSLHNSTENSLVRMLATGNQNAVSQVATSVSQQCNQINHQALQTAVTRESVHPIPPSYLTNIFFL